MIKNIILEMRAELVVTKLRFSWKICTECTPCISKPKVGDTKLPILLEASKGYKRTGDESRRRRRLRNYEI